MNSKTLFTWLGRAVMSLALIGFAHHGVQAQRGGGGGHGGGPSGGGHVGGGPSGGGHVGGAAPQGFAPAARPFGVEHPPIGRFEHGSIGHVDSPAIRDHRFDHRHFEPEIGRGHFFFRGFFPA